MKHLSIIALTFFIINSTKAQVNYTPTGTWKYINGADTIEVFFGQSQLVSGSETFPLIVGFHKYVKNGQVVESNLSQINSSHPKYSIRIPNIDSTYNRLGGDFRDLSLFCTRDIFLKKINPTTIDVTLTSIERWQQNRPPNNAYTLPRHFTLLKQ
jgi:hypothetical protein